MRSSIESARIAEPVYSITQPVPPPIPMRAITARIISLAETPFLSVPSTRTANVFEGRCSRHCVASTCSTSRGADAERQCTKCSVRRGMAIAANHRHPRLRQPLLRPDHVDDPLLRAMKPVTGNAEVRAVLLEHLHLRLRDLIHNRKRPRTSSACCDRSSRWSGPAVAPSACALATH